MSNPDPKLVAHFLSSLTEYRSSSHKNFANICYNALFLQTEDEKEMVLRTVYCTNIDKKVCKPFFLVGCMVANLNSDYT
jgi:hypothetical protein